MIMETGKRYYVQPVTEVVDMEVNRVFCASGDPDFWGYAPERVDEGIAKDHTFTA